MTLYLDHKYIGLVSTQLPMFRKKRDSLYNCRCPICGDSKKSKTKARGFFFVDKGQFFYKCHNCQVCMSLANFLKEIAPALFKEYIVERYQDGSDRRNTPKPDFKFTKPQFPSVAEALRDITPLTKLDANHPAIQFLAERRFPETAYKLLYYTDDFASWAQLLDPTKLDLQEDEPRLVIPFFNREGELYAGQGRSLDPAAKLRYITIVADREDGLSNRRWFGLERHDPDKTTFVLEGPLDTFFLENAIAMGGAGAFADLPAGVDKETSVIIYDNEPRNREIGKYMLAMLKRGFRVCVWPRGIEGKDINEMILAGRDPEALQQIIQQNAYRGLEGIAKLSVWKKR